jgi:ABC-type transport system involved in cytochrome bd biosynthesis fused ATPase/permease subunit
MDKAILNAINEDAKKLDDLYYSLGDVLDVKASVILVVVTFLGTLTGGILSLNYLPKLIKWGEALTVVDLCVIGVLTIASLWVKTFRVPQDPQLLMNWALDLEETFKWCANSSELVLEEFQKERTSKLMERIRINKDLARRKVGLVKWAFRFTALAVVLSLASLLWLAMWRL